METCQREKKHHGYHTTGEIISGNCSDSDDSDSAKMEKKGK